MSIVASRGMDQFPIRFPEGMREEIKAAAARNGRSMNSEILDRLSQSGIGGGEPPLTASVLADALDCFWNAAIGSAQNSQEGMATASAMAEGFAAVSLHLKEYARERQ